MAMRIVPQSSHPTSASNTSKPSKPAQQLETGAPSAPGLHDTLRSSLTSSQTADSPDLVSSSHPLEARLTQWTQTQQQLQSQILRRNFGIAEPLRRGMELKMVREADSFRPAVMGRASGVHQDILTGRDTEIAWEDVYHGQDGLRVGNEAVAGTGWHEEMEKKVGMGKW